MFFWRIILESKEVSKNISKKNIKIVDELIKHYQENPVIQGLVKLIFGCMGPIGSFIDGALFVTIESIRKDRLRVFFDELSDGKVLLTEEIIKSEDFIHAFFATTNAALKTRRHEKIKLFARLLKSLLKEDKIHSIDEYIDEYEEYLKILDDLTFRELIILTALEKYEQKYPQHKGTQKVNKFWKDFVKEISSESSIKEELPDILSRLRRTGCYMTFTGLMGGNDEMRGKLTPTYYRLKELLD